MQTTVIDTEGDAMSKRGMTAAATAAAFGLGGLAPAALSGSGRPGRRRDAGGDD